MSAPVEDNFKNNILRIAQERINNSSVTLQTNKPVIKKEEAESTVGKLRELFVKKDPEKLKEAETAINRYGFEKIKETLEKTGHPEAYLFLLSLVSAMDKEPQGDIVSGILHIDSIEGGKLAPDLRKELAEIPPAYLELLTRGGWKILFAKNSSSLIKENAVEIKDKKDTAIGQNQELLENIKNKSPEIKLNIDSGNVRYENLENFRKEIFEKIREKVAEKEPFYNAKEVKENLSKIFSSAADVKKMIQYLQGKGGSTADSRIEYLFGDSIEYIKALGDFYKLNAAYNGNYISLEDLEFLKQWDRGGYIGNTDTKRKLILFHPERYEKNEQYKKKQSSSINISTLKHETYHAVEFLLMEEDPLYFLKHIQPEIERNYKLCKEKDSFPELPGSPGIKDEQGKMHDFLREYSARNKEEYAADTFSAYFDPNGNKALEKTDPNQHSFIKNLTELLMLAKDIAGNK